MNETIDKKTEGLGKVLRQFVVKQALEAARGRSITDLVYGLQNLRDLQEAAETHALKETYEIYISTFLQKIAKREQRRYPDNNPSESIIQAIKDSVNLDDVIAWYCEVFTYKNKWTFRCHLHGVDRDPSGVIYRDERRWWCYGCNRGGDVFDFVCIYGGMDLSSAIRKLAQYCGIEVDFPPNNMESGIEKRVSELENSTKYLTNKINQKTKDYKYDR